MADGIAIGLEDFLSSSAKNYFRRHGKLPPRDLAVSDVSVPAGPPAFETLLSTIKSIHNGAPQAQVGCHENSRSSS